MEVKIEHNRETKKFSASLGADDAYLKYRELPDGNYEFYTTFVPDSGRGMGIARKLVDAGIEFAKSEDKKIKPTCSYVEKYLKRDPSLSQLIL